MRERKKERKKEITIEFKRIRKERWNEKEEKWERNEIWNEKEMRKKKEENGILNRWV